MRTEQNVEAAPDRLRRSGEEIRPRCDPAERTDHRPAGHMAGCTDHTGGPHAPAASPAGPRSCSACPALRKSRPAPPALPDPGPRCHERRLAGRGPDHSGAGPRPAGQHRAADLPRQSHDLHLHRCESRLPDPPQPGRHHLHPRLAQDDCRPTTCQNIAYTDRDIAELEAQAAELQDVVNDPLTPSIRKQRGCTNSPRIPKIIANHTRTK